MKRPTNSIMNFRCVKFGRVRQLPWMCLKFVNLISNAVLPKNMSGH